MDISDERKKKLEAGKEKLAAFRKKKAKSKKATKDNGDNVNLKEVVEPLNNGNVDCPLEVLAEGFVQPTQNNDHIYNLEHGKEFLSQEPEADSQVSKMPADAMSHQELSTTYRVGDVAEGIADSMDTETERFGNEENTNSNCSLEMDAFKETDLCLETETTGYQKALAQRDKLIGQLTHSLKSNADQQVEKEELVSQVLTLSQQVSQLQTQLEEADHTLQEQLQLHGISGTALQSAKGQMLQLQSIVQDKDRELVMASQMLERNHDTLCRSKEENARLLQSLNEKEEELYSLQQSYEAAVSSHEEKQEKEESEKSHQLFALQSEWKEKEGVLNASLDKQAKEIEGWRKCEKDWKDKEMELQQNYENLVNRLQQEESGKDERMRTLENDLEQLRQQREEAIKEAEELKRENEDKSTKLDDLSSENVQLSLLHSNMVDDLQALKSKNIDTEESLTRFKMENEAMRAELEELSSKLADEQEKLKLSHEQQGELESRHSLDCDRLNNKINELQSNLSHAQGGLASLEKAIEEEKNEVRVLQEELASKESSHENTSQELESIVARNTEIQSAIEAKDGQIKELEKALHERSNLEESFKNTGVELQEDKLKLEECVDSLTKELMELKDECDKYVLQIELLENERLSAVDNVDTLNEQLEKKSESLVRESERCKGLETQLHILEEERTVLNANIKALNDDIDTLKDDLHKERLQIDIIGEELISANSRLVESNNILQNKDDEHKGLLEKHRSDIKHLQNEVDRFGDLDSKLTFSSQSMDKLNAELQDTLKSLQDKTLNCEELTVEVERLREGERNSVSKIEDLEGQMAEANLKHKEVIERETESVQNQEELQRQLETTVAQWQKLQLIVQEKEIELQNLHDDLDEQMRICNTMKRNHDDYLETIQCDVDDLRGEKERSEARISELEGLLAGVNERLAAKDVELCDTITKVETVGVASQNVTSQLSEKERELDEVVRDKDRLHAELSGKEIDIGGLKEEITKADNEIARLVEALDVVKTECDAVKSELEEKDSVLNSLEKEKKELLDKAHDSSLQVEKLQTQLLGVEECSNKMKAENNDLKSTIAELKISCAEKEESFANEQSRKEEIEKLLDLKSKRNIQLLGELSSLSQDVEAKDDMLVVNCAALEEKVTELSQKEEDLVKRSDELQHLYEELENVKEEVKTNEAKLALTNNDNDSIVEKLQHKDLEMDRLIKGKEELSYNVSQLQDKLKEMAINADEQVEKTNELNMTMTHLQNSLGEKEAYLSNQQETINKLTEKLNAELHQSSCLKGALSSMSSEAQEKEDSLIQHGIMLEEKISALSHAEAELLDKDKTITEMEEKNRNLEIRVEELSSNENSLQTEVMALREQVDKEEQDLSELSATNRELSERQSQLEQEVKKQEGDNTNLQQDYEILHKECCDLRADLQEKEDRNVDLMQQVESMKSVMENSNVEKEMLKNNFDACLEEMHQKASSQDIEISHLKSKMAEDSRSGDLVQEEMKEMYNQQMAVVEDKLMEVEREKRQLEKKIKEKDAKLDRVKDDYEHQISEIELSLHASQADKTKMRDSISKINADHDNELTDLKSLHELQMSELMDNYLTLEKSMGDLQKTLSDQAEAMKQERSEMEQSFENLMSEMDERKRRSDSDINRLKKQLDEMNKDHEKELKALEKRYEMQLFDLEDRCSVTTSELERVRNSVVGVEGDFVQERRMLENKIGDLEQVRRDLEIKCTILEDDIALMKEQSNNSEEEVKAILKTAAEKQSEMRYEMEDMEQKMKMLKMNNESSYDAMKRELENRVKDLNAENEHLKSRLNTFEINAQLDMEMKGNEVEGKGEEASSKLEDLKKQMVTLTDENMCLKRRLLGYKSLEKKVRLMSSGVEEQNREEVILPTHMRMVTSTPSKKSYEDDDDAPFSPTAEEVSLIEGFVSETNVKPVASHRFDRITPQQSANEEPDFVVEEEDRFQPETVIEKAVDDFSDGQFQLDVHPIQDNEVTEGFQPELSDQFFVEMSEESNTDWPVQLSVGLSPTPGSDGKVEGFFDENDGVQEEIVTVSTAPKTLSSESVPVSESVNETCHGDDLMDKRIKQMKEDMEEDYAFQLRKQKQEVIIEYESKYENMEKELEQHFVQKEYSIKHEWEIKFAQALKKMKKNFEKKLHKQSVNQEEQHSADEEEDDVDGDDKEDKGTDEHGDVVEQLSKENQELAEVRDELLKQIEISQARGRHNRVQHQLRSMLSERESGNASFSQNTLSSNDGIVEPEIVAVAETVSSCAFKPRVAPISVDVQTTTSCQVMKSPERSPTVDAERILEELEDIEQQSSQDLPLEWELTNTVPVEEGVTSEISTGQHQSVWEVFGSRCERQDCVEVRNRYRRLCQCVVTSFGIGEELLSDESGLVQGVEGDGDKGDFGGRKIMGQGLKGAVIEKSDDNKGNDNGDDDDEDEVDELFADNVALESELLVLAENMVLYKDAFMNKKTELEKENEFLRLELETESKSRLDKERKFNDLKEEMGDRIRELEIQLVESLTTDDNDKNKDRVGTDKAVMTEGASMSQHDVDVLKSDLEDKMNKVVGEKQKTIDALQMEMDFFKSQIEEEIGEHKENAGIKIKALERELTDLRLENNYLCLTHEGKEETIIRLISEVDQSVSERDSMNETISEKESNLLDLTDKVSNLSEGKDMLEALIGEKEEEIWSLASEMRMMKRELDDRSKLLTLKKIQLVDMGKEIETLKEENKELQLGLREKEQEVFSLGAELTQLNEQIENKAKTLTVKEADLEKIQRDLKSALDAKDEEIGSQNSDVKKLTSQLEESVKNSSGIINRLESKIGALEKESDQLQKDVQEKDKAVSALTSEVNQLKSDKENRDEMMADRDSRLGILENELLDKEERIASLESASAKWSKVVKSVKLEATEAKDKLTSVKNENDKYVEEHASSLEKEKSDLLSDVAAKKEKLSISEAKISSLTSQLKNLEQENDKLQQKVEEQVRCQSSSEDAVKILEDQVTNLQEEKNKLLADIETNYESASKLDADIDRLNSEACDLKADNDRLSSKAEESQQELDKAKDSLRILEEQLSGLQEENANLQSVVEGKKESLSKSEMEIDSLGSELHQLSTRLDELQVENDKLRTLQDEVGDLAGQRDALLEDQKHKQDVIEELREDIDQLKAQLVNYERKVEDHSVQKESIQPVEAEVVCERYCGNESSHVANSDENCQWQSDIVEKVIIPVASIISEQQAVNDESNTELASDGRNADRSRNQNESVASDDVFDSVASPSQYISTSSIPADEASMISSNSMDQSSGIVSPAELQDQALAEELNQLKKDLRETKAIYSRENSLLHEALEREKRVKDFVMNKNDAESNKGTASSKGDDDHDRMSEGIDPETEMIQRLAVCLEQNKMLEEENGKLRTKIRKQEAVVLIYKHRLSEKEHDSELWRKSLTGQLQALQKQRDDLVQLLRNQEMGLSNSCPTISEAIGQAALKEESLRRVQDDLMEKMEEMDHLHQMLTQRQVELQHCDMERRHLEQLCVLKDQTEMQLMKQKRLMEEQVCEIEHRLKERETMLAEEKSRLLDELKEKDDRLLQMSQPQSPRSPLAASSPRSFSMGDLSSTVGATPSFGVDLNSSADEADKHHLKTIETLREKLRLEYSVRSSRLAESQASAVASYWMRRQSSNSKDGSQNLDTT